MRLGATPVLILLAPALVGAAPAPSPPSLCMEGTPTIIRVSKILPSGSMDGFRKAVADNNSWYAGHGMPEDRQLIARVIDRDPVAKKASLSADTVMTLHVHAHPSPPRDAAWDAFVAEYNANSQMVSETMVCMPDGG